MPQDVQFLSTPSARRATPASMACSLLRPYFYPRPPRGGRPRAQRKRPDMRNFYPRPPRGGRRFANAIEMELIHFYPRPPRGGRLCNRRMLCKTQPFLSTPSARRATVIRVKPIWMLINFYPRPPRGGRHADFCNYFANSVFLSTPSVRRATKSTYTSNNAVTLFLSTPSVRRATYAG